MFDLSTYPFKTEPRDYQRNWLENHAFDKAHALHWEMGTGKSKEAIDNIGVLYLAGEIDGVLVVAPNGIDLNWIIDEIPKHLPDSIAKQTRFCRFSTKKSKTKWHKEQIKWCREHHGLAWMTMSYDAFMTLEGKEAALLFIEARKAFYVLDESTRIKTPGAKRTMRITRTAWRAKYKRTLTGTPMPKGAFDIYSPMKFLDEDFWKRHGWDDAGMFKSYFGVFEKNDKRRDGREFEQLIGYQHLDELNKLIEPISTRILKRDVLDLPPKIYQSRWFELTPQQRKIYDALRNEYRFWLDEKTLITANLAIVRLLRLQQISCGYLPVGEGEPVHIIEGGNPRLELLEELLEDTNEKMIIWSKYRLDIDLITDMLRTKNSNKFVIYDGRTSEEDMIRAKEEFQKGDAQFFISNPAKGGEGLTLHAAEKVVYYTNGFNLNHRLQSEDRAHRFGLTHPVSYIDLLGVDTIDLPTMKNLCGKMDISDQVLGDAPGVDLRANLKQWLEEQKI